MNRVNSRNTTVEMLRIIAILMVIISHVSFHGFYTVERYNWITTGLNRWFLQVVNMGSLGVDIFIILSGYYLIESTSIKIKKVSTLLAEVCFYSFILYLCAIELGIYQFKTLDLIKSLLPTTFGSYWFFTAYITLYLLHPYINQLLLQGVEDPPLELIKKRISLLLLFITLWSIPHTFLGADLYAGEICQFIMLYSIGAFIRLYSSYLNKNNHAKIVRIGVLACIIWILLPLIGVLLNNYIPVIGEHITYFYSRNSILTIICGTFLVWYFTTRPSSYNASVNWFSSSVFGVYLITDNYFVRSNVYESVFHLQQYGNQIILIPLVLLVTVILFFIPTIIDKLGGTIYRKIGCLFNSALVKLVSVVSKKIDSLEILKQLQ